MPTTLQLRSVQQDDLPVFFEQQLDPDATQMASFPPRERDAFMAHWRKILTDETTIVRTILFDGHVAGNLVSWVGSGERDIGYWLGREYWGKGIASEALKQFLEHVTERPLYAHVARHNIGSLRVLEKSGFQVHGEDQVEGIEEFIMKLD